MSDMHSELPSRPEALALFAERLFLAAPGSNTVWWFGTNTADARPKLTTAYRRWTAA